MINLAPSAVDAFTESVTLLAESVTLLAGSATEITSGISQNVPIIGNVAICADSLCTVGRASINFYCSPSPLGKVFFGASCVCGTIGAVSSGAALATSFAGIPIAGWLGSFGARSFNRLGKYSLHMGNATSGNLTNVSAISDLMS
jgi:hypothetical protein